MRIPAAAPVALALSALTCAVPRAAAQADAYAAADSADVADEALAGLDPADVADAAEALADAATPPRRARNRIGAEIVRGYRDAERVTAVVRGLAMGARRQSGRTAQWVDLRTGTWIERVTAGGLRLRCGENLLLGARRSRFGSTRTRTDPGLTAGPSLSLSRPLRGVALAVRSGNVRASAAVWERDGSGDGRWASVECRSAGGALAISGGSLPGPANSAAVSLAGRTELGPCGLAAEVARTAGKTLALVRTSVDAAGRWSADIFDAAGAASGGVADVGVEAVRERGAIVRRHDDVAGWETTAAFHAVYRTSRDRRRRRRRIDARAVRRTAAGLRYRVSVRVDADEDAELPGGGLASFVETTATRRGRLRARLDIPAGSSTTLRYQLDTVLEAAVRPGFASGFEVRVGGRRGDLRAAVTNVSLPGAGGGIVARPGIAGYETVSAAGRRGSDIAIRATVYLGDHADVGLYAGRPWQRGPRYLAAARLRW